MSDLRIPVSMGPQAPVNSPPSELTTELKTQYAALFQCPPSKEQYNAVMKQTKTNEKPKKKNKKRKASDEKAAVPRPANSFMLYRCWMHHTVYSTLGVPQSIFSKMAGHYWNGMPASTRRFWEEMQEETRKTHALENPGWQFCPAKPGEGHAAKRCKTESPTSSASPPALTPTADAPQTPAWDAVPQNYQFEFSVPFGPSQSRSVVSSGQLSPISYTSSPPVWHEEERLRSPGYLTSQAFVDSDASREPSPPQSYTLPSFNFDAFDGHASAVAGPSNQQYAQPHTPAAYSLDAFDGQAFVNGYPPKGDVYTDEFNTVLSQWDPTQPIEGLNLALSRHRFGPEKLLGINLDELERDDPFITTMSPDDQRLFAWRLDARNLLDRSEYDF